MGASVSTFVVDPHILRTADRDAVELRIPVADGAIVLVPHRSDVAKVDDIQVAHDDISHIGDRNAGVDQAGVAADADQGRVTGQLDFVAPGLVVVADERPAVVRGGHVDRAA